MYTDQEVTIRQIKEEDLPKLWQLIYKEDSPEWKKWDAPYFPHQSMPFEKFMETIASSWIAQEDFWVVTVNENICGVVSYYFEDKELNWLEFGIVIHESGNWNRGIGTRVLTLWIDHIFHSLPVIRVGLTTWSGNKRMMKVGEKLGMQLEARIRKVRFYEGHYYDSIRMGILREEWQALKVNRSKVIRQ